MATFDVIRAQTKKAKKIRVTVTISQVAFDALVKLHEQSNESSASAVVASALLFAYRGGMYRNLTENIARVQMEETGGKKHDVPNKADWCILYGGTYDGVNCGYNKYEIGATGQIMKNFRQFPLKSMPDTQDDFRKHILGGFPTLAAAEVAYKNQAPSNFD
jgi:hypothetical protein